MSMLSSGLKKIGTVAKKAAPLAGLIPGVGTLAGGAIGGLGALAAGDGLKGALKYGAIGATSGLAGSKLLGGRGILGVKDALTAPAGGDLTAANAAGDAATRTTMDATRGVDGGLDWGNLTGKLAGAGSTLSGMGKNTGISGVIRDKLLGGRAITPGNVAGAAAGGIGKVAGAARDNPEIALASLAAILGAKQSAEAARQREAALAGIKGRYNARAPLRDIGMSGLTAPKTVNLSSLFADPENAYAR